MQLEHTSDQNIEFFRLPRRVLMADARLTKNALLGLILSAAQPRVAIDMSDVKIIDSSGLAALVECLHVSRRRSGDVCLFGMRDATRLLFKLTRLYSVFPVVELRQDAVEWLSA